MKDIAIYGAGGFGREVACLIRRINDAAQEPIWNLIGFFDDDSKLAGHKVSHFGHCLGGLDALNSHQGELAVVMAIGDSNVVKKVLAKIANENIDFPNLIHPKFALVDKDTFSIGEGNIIQGDCAMSCDVSIGNFNILNGSVVFGHDDRIGSFNTFMPAVRVSGEVLIGDGNFFGVGAIVLQQLKIGDNVRLGAGGVLMTKPKDGCLYIGNPARKTEY